MSDFFRQYYLKESIDIIESAIEKYNPSSIFVAYSGGRDSAIILDIASKIMASVEVMAIDTGLAHDEWRGMIESQVSRYPSARLTFVEGLGIEWYQKNVLEYGFGYTPQQHSIYYRMLKERAINKLIAVRKIHYHDKIAFLTGVRRAESAKRLKTPDVMVSGARLTINAIAHYDNQQAQIYHALNLPFYDNPIYKQWSNSGDCACNWTCKISLETLERTSPILASKISRLSQDSVNRGGWKYGTKPSDYGIDLSSTVDNMPEDSLCISCYKNRLI